MTQIGNLSSSCRPASINGVLYAIGSDKVWKWDGKVWIEEGDLLVPYGVTSLIGNNDKLYAGQIKYGVWSNDGTGWSLVGGNSRIIGKPNSMGISPNVFSLASLNNILYAAAGDSGVWTWDGAVWSQIGDVGIKLVYCLADINGTLYVGTDNGVWCYQSQQEHGLSSIFMDITNHWARENIKQLVSKGIVSGYPDGLFKPDNPISRAEFITLLVKALKLEPKQGESDKDTENHWASSSISTAEAKGIIEQDENFRPNEPITREEIAVMIIKAKKLNMATQEFNITESKDISNWAKDYIFTAMENNLMNGYPDGSFKPKGSATRAEAVTVIVKL